MTFKELDLLPEILRAVEEMGYEKPTPIQKRAIPEAIKGRDVLGCAQTGTGKTAAFSIPILQQIHENKATQGRKPIRSLILTPTRELAAQIGDNIKAYGKFLPSQYAVIFGGVNQNPQVRRLKAGVDILVATPGRLLDLMNQGYISLKNVEFFVLDEADRMLDMGFIHDINKILPKLPPKKQTMFFSATMPPAIVKMTKTLLHDPVSITVDVVSSAATTVTQEAYHVLKPDKKKLLLHLLKNPEIDQALVFSRTKRGADRLSKILAKAKITSGAIHGDKSQGQRERALKGFKDGNLRILVATDIAARGIDIDSLSYVINYDIPNEPETYVHRIGRTGRAGANGKSISLCDIDERPYVKSIEKLTGKKIEFILDHPFQITDEGVKAYKELQASYAKQNEIQMQKRREAKKRRREQGNTGGGSRNSNKRRR
ncbi:MAG: DEAD/DEAH box helicase [Crocinitomicaceae bacterium]|nr:DEAD/DEAH box helicase [Crocinitomicaceae bacterium]